MKKKKRAGGERVRVRVRLCVCLCVRVYVGGPRILNVEVSFRSTSSVPDHPNYRKQRALHPKPLPTCLDNSALVRLFPVCLGAWSVCYNS
jgi:hypothetical protein